MSYCKMAVVTGGLGFIGKNFINELAPKYKNILLVHKFSRLGFEVILGRANEVFNAA